MLSQINEWFTLLLILLSHNINVKELGKDEKEEEEEEVDEEIKLEKAETPNA